MIPQIKPRLARTVLVAMGLVFSLGQTGMAQVRQPPPPPLARPTAPPDLNRLSHELADRIRHLGEDIASDLGRTPQGRHLLQDLNELAQTADEFHDSLRNTRDSIQQRQSYAGIRQTWLHIKEQLARPGFSSPAIDRAARRVDEVEGQIQQALGLRVYPQVVVGDPRGPRDRDFARLQRLVYTLHNKSEVLAAALRTEANSIPNGIRFIRQGDRLVQTCGAFYDSLQPNQRPEAVQQAFAPLAAAVDRLSADFQTVKRPPLVDREWLSFVSTEALVRQDVNSRLPQPGGGRPIIVPPRPVPLLPLADQLVQQIDAFVRTFSVNGGEVPENRYILSDALRLQADAAEFRRHVRQGAGYDQNRLANEFVEVDVSTQRLARRVYRIAQGRNGPSIQLVQNIEASCERLRNVIGSPNFGVVITRPSFPGRPR